MKIFTYAALLLLTLHCAFSAHNLNEEYRFSVDLDDTYKLHWSFDLEAETISFAVNVSTTGWVGFGLSPNGQMPSSDVIIGWVKDNGQVMFKDRYAIDRFLPPVDESQDWFLVSGEEENGYTILEFTRNLTTCDDRDLNIQADTSRVIWSYHSSDPTSESAIPQHESVGSASINLLGGLQEDRVEPDSDDFSIVVGNVTIPAVDTTYWCRVSELPPEVRQQERYIYKLSPVISEAAAPYVHHILIYLCTELNGTHLGASSACEDTHIDIRTCRGNTIIAAWAVGGADFVFPPEVALPLGGDGARRYVVIEMHYDNPTLQSGVADNSGVRFTYSNTHPAHLAGVLTVGSPVSPSMIIPPRADDFTVAALCPGECTQGFPPEGITLFGNILHTHLAGHGLIVQHLRRNAQCGLLEELQPIDENRKYDFNYQQTTILPRRVTVLPGDEIKVQCFYRTSSNSQVTLGGESTRDEMCFTFLYYYPQTDLAFCTTIPEFSAYQNFAMKHLNSSVHSSFYEGLRTRDPDGVRAILNEVDWTQGTIDTLQSLLLNSTQTNFCTKNSRESAPTVSSGNRLPSPDCPYVPPNICTGEVGSQGQCCTASGSVRLRHLSSLLHVLWITVVLIFSMT